MIFLDSVGNIDFNENVARRLNEAELFTRRFGSFSKSDYEVLMFTIYLDSLEEPVRDYDISIALGITESKVRNLRVRSQLLYPKEIRWQEELAAAVAHGYYDSQTKQITVTIEDPSVQSLIKNTIEKNFGIVGQSLNTKQLVLPVESFLILAAYAEDDVDKVLMQLNKQLQKLSFDTAKIEKKQLKARFFNAVPDAISFINSVISVYQVGVPIVTSVLELIKNQGL